MTAREFYDKRIKEDSTIGTVQFMEEFAEVSSKPIRSIQQIKEQITRADNAANSGIKNYEELTFEDSVIFILEWVLGLDDDEPIEFY